MSRSCNSPWLCLPMCPPNKCLSSQPWCPETLISPSRCCKHVGSWMHFWRFPLQTQKKLIEIHKIPKCWISLIWGPVVGIPEIPEHQRDCYLTLKIPNQQLPSTPAPSPCVACRRSRRSGRCRAEACLCSRSDMGAGAILRCKRFQNWEKKRQWRLPQNWDFIKSKNFFFLQNLYIILLHINLLHLSISNKWRGFLPAKDLENQNPERPYTWGIGTGMPGTEWAGGGLPCWKLGDTVDGRNPANQLICSLSHYLTGFYTCQVVSRISEPSTVFHPKKKTSLEDHPMTDVYKWFFNHGDRFRPRFLGVMGPLPNGPNSRLINGGWSDHYLHPLGWSSK